MASKRWWWFDERVMQVLLLLLFFIKPFSENSSTIANIAINGAFLINYALLAFGVNYFIIPKYYHHGRYGWVIILGFTMVFIAAFVEEQVLEKIFYPSSRGQGEFSIWNIIGTIPEFLPIVSIFVFVKLTWDFNERQERLMKLEKERTESELKFLKLQLNPHVLFNNLNNLYSFALHDSAKTPERILRLSDILRYMLYEAIHERVPLKREMKFISDYIALQQMTIEGRGDVTYKNEVVPGSHVIAPLLLVPFIENCFKHSSETTVKGIWITIELRMNDNRLEMIATNNLGERTSEFKSTEGGIGLDNVKRRLDILYTEKHNLKIMALQGLFIVHLTLDLK